MNSLLNVDADLKSVPETLRMLHKLDEFYEIRGFLHFTSPEGELVGSLSQHLRLKSVFLSSYFNKRLLTFFTNFHICLRSQTIPKIYDRLVEFETR